MQTQDEVEGLHNCRGFSQPLECLYQAMQTQEKVFYCSYQIFLKINSTNKGNFVYWLLDQKDFLNTRSIQSSFLLTNQNAKLITHERMKFRVTKVKSKFKSPASKRASCKWKWYQLWILLNLWEKWIKFGENRGNIQKIYNSVRKELRDEYHCTWSLLKVTWSCPIWQSEKIIEKLNCSSCLVKFCWFGIIAQAGRVEFTAARSEGMKPIILVSCLVHSSKFKWSFFEHLTPKTRQPIGRVKFDFKTFAVRV